MKRNAIKTKINCDIDIEYAIKALKYNNGWILLYDWHQGFIVEFYLNIDSLL